MSFSGFSVAQPAIAELVQDFEGLALHDHNVVVAGVGHIQESLLRIHREFQPGCGVCGWATAVYEHLVDVLAVERENLDSPIGPVGNVNEPVVRCSNPMSVTPLRGAWTLSFER